MDLSPELLIASMVVSSVGMGIFMYGRKQVRTLQIVIGLALMIEPYFSDGVGSTLGIAALLLGAMGLLLRSGA